MREDIAASARFQAMVAGQAAEQGRAVEDVAAERGRGARRDGRGPESPRDRCVGSLRALGRPRVHRRRGHEPTRGAAPAQRAQRRSCSCRATARTPTRSSWPVLAGTTSRATTCSAATTSTFWPIGPLGERAGLIFIRRTFEGRRTSTSSPCASTSATWSQALQPRVVHRGRPHPHRQAAPAALRAAGLPGRRLGEAAGARTCYLVPVSIAYDQLHEVGAMAAEQRGGTKQAEGLALARSATCGAQRRSFGAVHVRFGEPLSLAEALAGRGRRPAPRRSRSRCCIGINGVTPSPPRRS